MPYIKKAKRTNPFVLDQFSTEGDYNYIITILMQHFLKNNIESYSTYNKIIGILESCKLEFYRRAVANYEDKKKKENGDVY